MRASAGLDMQARVQEIVVSHCGEDGSCLRFGKSNMPSEHTKIVNDAAAADEAKHHRGLGS